MYFNVKNSSVMLTYIIMTEIVMLIKLLFDFNLDTFAGISRPRGG